MELRFQIWATNTVI